MKRKYTALLIVASLSAALTSANAIDLYRSGTGTWDGTSLDWGTASGGPYNTTAWTNGDSAFFEGTQGTITLDSNFTADAVAIGGNTGSATNYEIGNAAGNNTITFTGTKTLTVNGVDATINTGIAGSPALTYNNRSDNASDLILNPGSLTQNFASTDVVKGQFGGDTNTNMVLGGTSVGNSTGPMTWSPGGAGHQLVIDRQGSGTWEIGSFTSTRARIRSTGAGGTLVLNGTTIMSHEIDIEAGTLTGTGAIGVTRGGIERVRVFAGAALAPGNGGIGTMTVQDDDFSWATNSTTAGMLFDLSSVDNMSDLLNITGTGSDKGGFVKDGTGTFIFDFSGGKAGETYTLVNFTRTDFLVGDFAVGTGIDGSFSLNSTSLQFTAVPEPGSAALLGLGALALFSRRRK